MGRPESIGPVKSRAGPLARAGVLWAGGPLARAGVLLAGQKVLPPSLRPARRRRRGAGRRLCGGCGRLQKSATDCNRLQQTAMDRNRLQQTAIDCNRLQQTKVLGS